MKFMKIERLGFDEFRDIFFRLSELKRFEKEHRIKTAIVVIDYSVQDVNNVIKSIKNDVNQSRDTGVFYQLMIKTDHILHSLETITKDLMYSKKETNKIIGKEIIGKIDRFKLLRSLTLAHPLETTRYNHLGYGKDNMKWCEDVRPYNRINSMLIKGDFDFIMHIINENEETDFEYQGINLETDIISFIRELMNLFFEINKDLSKQLNKQITQLKRSACYFDRENPNVYFDSIICELKKRYPSKVESIKYLDGTIREDSLLHTVKKLCLIELPKEQENFYYKFRTELKLLIYEFEESLKKMEFENEESEVELKIREMIYPSSILLKTKIIGENKIIQYLSKSTQKSSLNIFLGDFNPSNCSNGEWGVYQLLQLDEELSSVFPFNFMLDDKLLYAQYVASIYLLKNKVNN